MEEEISVSRRIKKKNTNENELLDVLFLYTSHFAW